MPDEMICTDCNGPMVLVPIGQGRFVCPTCTSRRSDKAEAELSRVSAECEAEHRLVDELLEKVEHLERIADAAKILAPHFPRHSHSTPGVWDQSNGPELGGTKCVECAALADLTEELRDVRHG